MQGSFLCSCQAIPEACRELANLAGWLSDGLWLLVPEQQPTNPAERRRSSLVAWIRIDLDRLPFAFRNPENKKPDLVGRAKCLFPWW